MKPANLCLDCNAPMGATDVVDATGEKRAVWKCDNPQCKCRHYFLRFDEVKAPEKDMEWRDIYLGFGKDRIGPLAECWYCPCCGNQLEILDVVYKIWNCPNCLRVLSGGFGIRFYPIVDGAPDYDHELIEERRPAGAYWDPEWEGEDEEDEDEEDEEGDE